MFYDNTIDVSTFTSQRLEGTLEKPDGALQAGRPRSDHTLRYDFTYRRVKASNIEVSSEEDPIALDPNLEWVLLIFST